jgi:uncharacterized protein
LNSEVSLRDVLIVPSFVKVEIATIEGKGRGVVAKNAIQKGETIEVAPVIILPADQIPNLKATDLFHYFFHWGKNNAAICLGYGSLYNHSQTPNCKYLRDFENNTMRFISLKDIAEGEEICTNYHGNENCKRETYFEKTKVKVQ